MISGQVGPDLGCPNVLTLPASIQQPSAIGTMTVKHFSAKFTAKGLTYSYYLRSRTNVGGTTELLQIAPIPPFLVYDGFEKYLNAAELIEPILAMDSKGVGQAMTLHLQQFLLSCLSSHNSNNTKLYVHSEIMM